MDAWRRGVLESKSLAPLAILTAELDPVQPKVRRT
jgi:hypothetical protein